MGSRRVIRALGGVAVSVTDRGQYRGFIQEGPIRAGEQTVNFDDDEKAHPQRKDEVPGVTVWLNLANEPSVITAEHDVPWSDSGAGESAH